MNRPTDSVRNLAAARDAPSHSPAPRAGSPRQIEPLPPCPSHQTEPKRIGFVLGPLITWLIKKDDHPFIDEQGKEALNFQITMLLAIIVSAFLCFIFIGFILLPVLVIGDVVFTVIASLKAKEGEHYRYPFAFRFIK